MNININQIGHLIYPLNKNKWIVVRSSFDWSLGWVNFGLMRFWFWFEFGISIGSISIRADLRSMDIQSKMLVLRNNFGGEFGLG